MSSNKRNEVCEMMDDAKSTRFGSTPSNRLENDCAGGHNMSKSLIEDVRCVRALATVPFTTPVVCKVQYVKGSYSC
jgi:hypothetical protein